jgi:hypothetical protein
MVESNLKTSLTRRLGNDAATDINIYVAKLPTNTAGYKVLEPDSLSKYELIYHESIVGTPGGPGYLVCPASNGRGLSLTSTTRLTVAENVKTHGSGVTIIEAPDHYTLNDKASLSLDNTWTGDQTFEGDTTFEQSITVPVYADATARDAAITSPTNGMEVYLTDTGKFYDYTAGAWIARESGGTFPNASDTVAGKVELATEAEVIAGTGTGATGAELVIPNDSTAIVATSAGVADAGKLARLGATGKFDNTLIDADDGQVDTTYTADEDIAAGHLVSKTSVADEVENTIVSALGTAGTESTFDATSADYIQTCNVADNKVAAFSTSGGTANLVIGTVDLDKNVTWGTDVPVVSSTTAAMTLKYMEDDKVVMCYRNTADDKVYARVATISGTVPTLGTASEVGDMNAAGQFVDVCTVDTDKLVVAFRDTADTNKGKARCATVSGTTIGTWGTAVEFEAGATDFISIAKFDTDKAGVFYRDVDDTNDGKGALLVATGTALAANVPVTFDTGNANNITVTQLDTDKILIAYTISYAQARVASLSGLTISYPTAAVVINAAACDVPYGLDAISSTEAYITYEETGLSDGKFNKLSVSGTTITVGTQYTINGSTNNVAYTSLAKVSDKSKFIICYKDEADANKGNAEVFQDYDNSDLIVGFNTATVTATNTAVVRSKGVIDNQAGLTAGTKYYLSDTGTLTSTANEISLGIAKDTDEIDINIDKTLDRTLVDGSDAGALHTHTYLTPVYARATGQTVIAKTQAHGVGSYTATLAMGVSNPTYFEIYGSVHNKLQDPSPDRQTALTFLWKGQLGGSHIITYKRNELSQDAYDYPALPWDVSSDSQGSSFPVVTTTAGADSLTLTVTNLYMDGTDLKMDYTIATAGSTPTWVVGMTWGTVEVKGT